MKGTRTFAMVIRFICELGMLAGLAYWGFSEHDGGSAWAFGIGLPVAAAVIWGAFVAPKAKWPVRRTVRWLIELVLFGGAATALIAADEPVLGGALLVFAVISSPFDSTAVLTTKSGPT